MPRRSWSARWNERKQLDENERTTLKGDTSPKGMSSCACVAPAGSTISTSRATKCRQRTLIADTQVFMLDIVPIARTQKKGKLTTIELDTKGLPPMVASKLRLRATSTAGIFELAANDDAFSELVATPAAAAKLDVVVRVCMKARVAELSFGR